MLKKIAAIVTGSTLIFNLSGCGTQANSATPTSTAKKTVTKTAKIPKQAIPKTIPKIPQEAQKIAIQAQKELMGKTEKKVEKKYQFKVTSKKEAGVSIKTGWYFPGKELIVYYTAEMDPISQKKKISYVNNSKIEIKDFNKRQDSYLKGKFFAEFGSENSSFKTKKTTQYFKIINAFTGKVVWEKKETKGLYDVESGIMETALIGSDGIFTLFSLEKGDLNIFGKKIKAKELWGLIYKNGKLTPVKIDNLTSEYATDYITHLFSGGNFVLLFYKKDENNAPVKAFAIQESGKVTPIPADFWPCLPNEKRIQIMDDYVLLRKEDVEDTKKIKQWSLYWLEDGEIKHCSLNFKQGIMNGWFIPEEKILFCAQRDMATFGKNLKNLVMVKITGNKINVDLSKMEDLSDLAVNNVYYLDKGKIAISHVGMDTATLNFAEIKGDKLEYKATLQYDKMGFFWKLQDNKWVFNSLGFPPLYLKLGTIEEEKK